MKLQLAGLLLIPFVFVLMIFHMHHNILTDADLSANAESSGSADRGLLKRGNVGAPQPPSLTEAKPVTNNGGDTKHFPDEQRNKDEASGMQPSKKREVLSDEAVADGRQGHNQPKAAAAWQGTDPAGQLPLSSSKGVAGGPKEVHRGREHSTFTWKKKEKKTEIMMNAGRKPVAAKGGSADLHDDYIAFKKEMEEEAKKEAANTKMRESERNGNVLENLKTLLLEETDQEAFRRSSLREEFPVQSGMYKTLKTQFEEDFNLLHNNFTMLVHSSAVSPALARLIAINHLEAMVLVLCEEDGEVGSAKLCAANSIRDDTMNVLIGGGGTGTLGRVTAQHEARGGTGSPRRPFATYQYFGNLGSICQNLLPYECEREVGMVLMLSRVSFFPRDLPNKKYFKYWETERDGISSLIRGAMAHAESQFGVKFEKMKEIGESSISSWARPYGGGGGDGRRRGELSEMLRVEWVSALDEDEGRRNGDSAAPTAGYELRTLTSFGLSKRDLRSIFQAYVKMRVWGGAQDAADALVYSRGSFHSEGEAEALGGDREDKNKRSGNAAADLQKHERRAVDAFYQIIQEEKLRGSVLVTGNGNGLFATKLARGDPASLVVTVVRDEDRFYSASHVALNDFLGVDNMFICEGALTPVAASAILDAGAENSFDYHVAGSDIVAGALADSLLGGTSRNGNCQELIDSFERELGRMFRLARSESYWIIPRVSVLVDGVDKILEGKCASELAERFSGRERWSGKWDGVLGIAEAAAGGNEGFMSILDEGPAGSFVKFGAKTTKKKKGAVDKVPTNTGGSGVSLYSLLWLGLEKGRHAKRVARGLLSGNFVRLSKESKAKASLEPWHIFLRGLAEGGPASYSEELWKVLKREIEKDSVAAPGGGGGKDKAAEGRFSFMTIGERKVGGLAARDFQNATIISAVGSSGSGEGGDEGGGGEEELTTGGATTPKEEEQKHWNHAGKQGLTRCLFAVFRSGISFHSRSLNNNNNNNNNNNANKVCSMETMSTLAKNLYESPELMRYNYWEALPLFLGFEGAINSHIGRAHGGYGYDTFGQFTGRVFSTGLTNFVLVPSATRLSLTHAIMNSRRVSSPASQYEDEQYRYVPFGKGARGAAAFDISNHPSDKFVGIEKKILKSKTKVAESGQTNVRMSLLKIPGDGGNGNNFDQGGVVVRVDILNCTRRVHHHYDYRKDGHTRTYEMSVVTGNERAPASAVTTHVNNGVATKVWLTREQDRHIIPYNTINSITLIALLRMGIAPDMKKRAYKKFVSMPLYEDMTPWNVVMRGSDYKYIDYDTAGKKFDNLVPHAYEILEVLMNYKRTVEDLDKCLGKGRNDYGFPYISDCIGTKFKGPCKDPAKPVPCDTKPEGTCQSDYITCLKKMEEYNEEEGNRSGGGGGGSGDDDDDDDAGNRFSVSK